MSAEAEEPIAEDVSEVSRRARLAVWWLRAEIVATGIFIAAALVYLVSIASLPASDPVDATYVGFPGTAGLVYALAIFGWLLALIVQTVVFLRWFYRAYGGLHERGVAEVRYGQNQAAWSWFVPILNLFRPKQIANDIWRAGDPGAGASDPDRARGPLPPLLTWWWAGWLVMNLGSVFVFPSATTVGAERTGLVITAGGLHCCWLRRSCPWRWSRP